MMNDIGNYARHAQYWNWGNLDHDRTTEHEYWFKYAAKYGKTCLPPCAL